MVPTEQEQWEGEKHVLECTILELRQQLSDAATHAAEQDRRIAELEKLDNIRHDTCQLANVAIEQLKAERDQLAAEIDLHIARFRTIEACLGTLDHSAAVDDEGALPELMVNKVVKHSDRLRKLRDALGRWTQHLGFCNETKGRKPAGETCNCGWYEAQQALLDSIAPAEPKPQVIELSPKDQAQLVESLLDPPEPNAALRKAFSSKPEAPADPVVTGDADGERGE